MYNRTWLRNHRNRVHIERHFELMLNPTSYMKMMAYIGFKIKQYVCMYACMCVRMHACVYVCTYTKKSGRIRVRLQREITWETANTYRGVYVYIYICMYRYAHVYLDIYIQIHIIPARGPRRVCLCNRCFPIIFAICGSFSSLIDGGGATEVASSAGGGSLPVAWI